MFDRMKWIAFVLAVMLAGGQMALATAPPSTQPSTPTTEIKLTDEQRAKLREVVSNWFGDLKQTMFGTFAWLADDQPHTTVAGEGHEDQ